MADESSVYRQRLADYINKIPLAVQHGTWDKAHSFKQWAEEARKALNNTGASEFTLRSLCNRYEAYQ